VIATAVFTEPGDALIAIALLALLARRELARADLGPDARIGWTGADRAIPVLLAAFAVIVVVRIAALL
jgi:hypothetical protein